MPIQVEPIVLPGSPQEVYARLGERSRTVLLESALAMPGLARWSYIAGPAAATLETRGHITQLISPGRSPERWSDPYAALAELLERLGLPRGRRPEGMDFAAGLTGHVSYDFGEGGGAAAVPELRLHLTDHVLAFDHGEGKWYFCTTSWPFLDMAERQAVWARTLAQAGNDRPAPDSAGFRVGTLASRTLAPEYLARVRRCLEYIREGDIYQANLSHRLEASFEGDAFALYQRMMQINPAPFAAYMEGEDFAIASASPERFLRLGEGVVTARPIKGTRSRAADSVEDRRLRDALAASSKDRAENVMIVDLLRNDLGRVARTGSVKVEELFAIEAHPSVWQMVSTVCARLREGFGPADLLRACWPPGSMTGAPKIRAMQIIDELEQLPRGPYAGSIGYFDAAGGMDLSVVIRTLVVTGGRVMLQVGGGIVADSDPEAELQESYAKGRLLIQALGSSEQSTAAANQAGL